ncbi:hypothetical protein [Sphingomonas sp. CROZ-RG-20F-R02-07]|uniref:hypothetical protein n=1 Tax=Sphingomonas sp. CROZ-RG-20F-R02-07 TaxID=2914832 RepID=UPI001F5A237A|nr:hypothetical protein [Sphingomonas sp. CROZ-RG-20F-R02-07]
MPLSIKLAMLLVIAMLAQAPAFADDAVATKAATPPAEKLICKTETVVGSLIPGPKRCHTRAQWEEHARAGQAIARKLVEDGTGRPTTN